MGIDSESTEVKQRPPRFEPTSGRANWQVIFDAQRGRLFDSILREYPISTLLVWKTNSKVRRRRFIDTWKSSLRLGDFYVEESDRKKNLVLDGQQHLQSLYIGLCGSFEGRELHFDVLSSEVAVPDGT